VQDKPARTSLVLELLKSMGISPKGGICRFALPGLGMKGPARDFFGDPRRFDFIQELLPPLPEPKTLITDPHTADHFPESGEIGVEPVEYMPG
jgi:hypothetical protein